MPTTHLLLAPHNTHDCAEEFLDELRETVWTPFFSAFLQRFSPEIKIALWSENAYLPTTGQFAFSFLQYLAQKLGISARDLVRGLLHGTLASGKLSAFHAFGRSEFLRFRKKARSTARTDSEQTAVIARLHPNSVEQDESPPWEYWFDGFMEFMAKYEAEKALKEGRPIDSQGAWARAAVLCASGTVRRDIETLDRLTREGSRTDSVVDVILRGSHHYAGLEFAARTKGIEVESHFAANFPRNPTTTSKWIDAGQPSADTDVARWLGMLRAIMKFLFDEDPAVSGKVLADSRRFYLQAGQLVELDPDIPFRWWSEIAAKVPFNEIREKTVPFFATYLEL